VPDISKKYVPDDRLDPGIPKGVFSGTQYESFLRCGRAYEFSYIKNIKRPPAGAMIRGTTVHRGAEEAHRHIIAHKKLPDIQEIQAVVSDAFDKEVKENEVIEWDEGENPGRVKDSAIRSYGVYHRLALPKVRPVAAEQPFVLYLDSTPVLGFIDLIDQAGERIVIDGEEAPGTLVVADLKVTQKSWSQTDIDRKPQFTLYSLATGIPSVRVDNLVQLKAGPDFKQLHGQRGHQDHQVLMEHMSETIGLIKKGVFPMTSIDNWMCSQTWCGYWSMCRGRR
jgi:hypothetical protein